MGTGPQLLGARGDVGRIEGAPAHAFKSKRHDRDKTEIDIYKDERTILKVELDFKKEKTNMIDLTPYFGTLAAVVGVVMLVSGWLKTYVIKVDGWKAQVMTWVVAAILTFVGQWQDLGLFADLSPLMTVLNGVAIGLVANGVYSLEAVQQVLELVKAKAVKAQ